jgi:heme exporter protein B
MQVLVLSLLIGAPALSFVGAIGAALTLSIRRGGLLLSLLVLPLYVPTVIFGAGAVTGATLGLDATQALMLLGGVTLVALVLGPLAAAAAVRLNLS